MNHYALGWSEVWDQHVLNCTKESLFRIVAKHRHLARGLNAVGQSLNCYVEGKVHHASHLTRVLPVVGDWCVIKETFIDAANERSAMIEEILPRRSELSRMIAGTETGQQVLAANIDYVFIVTSANQEFSINRLRRYLLVAKRGRVKPIIVLSKIDQISQKNEINQINQINQTDQTDQTDRIDQVDQVDQVNQIDGGAGETTGLLNEIATNFAEIPLLMTSAINGVGIEEIRRYLGVGQTAAFVGSSGVGKSTLVNALLSAEVQATNVLCNYRDRGQHTTSSAGLFFIEGGGMIIDTPGLREVHVMGDEEDLEEVMPTISNLSKSCKFRDCSHKTEPGCQVLSALAIGDLKHEDYDYYTKLERELAFSQKKLNQRLATEERRRWLETTKKSRERYQFK